MSVERWNSDDAWMASDIGEFVKYEDYEVVEAERNYLLNWLGGFETRLRGLSADALSLVALGIDAEPHHVPHDRGDLGRCERAYEAMPPSMQEKALALLTQWLATEPLKLRSSQLETLRLLPTTADLLAAKLKVTRHSARSRLTILVQRGFARRGTVNLPWNPYVYILTEKGKEALRDGD